LATPVGIFFALLPHHAFIPTTHTTGPQEYPYFNKKTLAKAKKKKQSPDYTRSIHPATIQKTPIYNKE